MSRTIRTNKYGETKTDKYKKNFNGCGCAYCEYINTDFRHEHRERAADNSINEHKNFLEDRYEEWEINEIIEEDHYLDFLSDSIQIFNQIKTTKQIA